MASACNPPGFYFFYILRKYLSLKHMPTVPIVGMGKEGRTLIGPWGT